MTRGYVPEIDGLRSIAVLSVVFYHAGFAALGGGFVGVDVFFVISGFLITRLIRDEILRTGRFSLLDFYARRVRRLFPALVATIALSGLAALALFSPQQLVRFAQSAVAAVLSASNVLFWLEADYFDAFATTKPLLHTWSLSVEEQFYLAWPLALVLLMRRTRGWGPPAVLALVCLASLALAEVWIPRDRAGAFFLLPTRVAELGLGALLVWLMQARPPAGAALEPLCLLGYALIGFAALRFTEATPFPGLNALVPCLGAALVIYACRARYAGAPLRSPPAVWIGRISYSLYLVHWPVVVFIVALRFDDLGPADRWAVLALSLALAALQHRLVEERFRHVGPASLPPARLLRRAAAVAAVCMLPAAAVIASGGLPGRIPTDRLMASARDQRLDVERRFCGAPDPALAGRGDLVTCQNYRGADRDIVIWGDSHAMHLAPGFARWFPRHNVHVAFRAACVPQRGFGDYGGGTERADCAAHNRAVLDFLAGRPPTTVILSGAKRGSPEVIAGAAREIAARLEAAGHTVAMLGDVVEPQSGRDLADCLNVPAWVVSDARRAARCVADPDVVAAELAYNDVIAALVPQFVPINDRQCPGGACRFFEGGRLLYRDDDHLSVEGSELFVGGVLDRLPIAASAARAED